MGPAFINNGLTSINSTQNVLKQFYYILIVFFYTHSDFVSNRWSVTDRSLVYSYAMTRAYVVHYEAQQQGNNILADRSVCSTLDF